MDQRMKNALTVHREKLAALEAQPGPYTWEVAGSIEFHRDAIRVIEKFMKAERQRAKASGAVG